MRANINGVVKVIKGIKTFDKILEQLDDAEWHSIDEISEKIILPPDELKRLIIFLQTEDFVRKKDEKLKITERGMRFLKL